MKTTILLILPLLFVVTSMKGIYSNAYLFLLKDVQLNPAEPLQLSPTQTTLNVRNVTGSIGVKTFSHGRRIEYLIISGSAIEHIEDGALCSLPSLYNIKIDTNSKFPKLTLPTLGNCDRIKVLDVSDVQLEPNAFRNMSSLTTLSIGRVNISNLTKEDFEPLANLESLTLSSLSMTHIDAGSLCASPKLNNLFLTNIRVPSPLKKGIFENCNNVDDFHLENHDLEEIGTFNGLTNVTSVKFVYLKQNLTKGSLSGLSNVRDLRIEHSRIRKISGDAFEGFSNLKRLTIIYSQVIEIESGAMTSLPSLENLYLSKNDLTTIDNISNPTLIRLHVPFNNISHIDIRKIKENLPRLNFLEISNNPIDCESISIPKLDKLHCHCDHYEFV